MFNYWGNGWKIRCRFTAITATSRTKNLTRLTDCYTSVEITHFNPLRVSSSGKSNPTDSALKSINALDQPTFVLPRMIVFEHWKTATASLMAKDEQNQATLGKGMSKEWSQRRQLVDSTLTYLKNGGSVLEIGERSHDFLIYVFNWTFPIWCKSPHQLLNASYTEKKKRNKIKKLIKTKRIFISWQGYASLASL